MIHAVVLAAGESRRMGQPKMLLPWGRSTVLGSVVSTLLASPVDSVVVVLGHRAEEHAPALQGMAGEQLRLVVNHRYQEGMLTSVQCGVRAVLSGEASDASWAHDRRVLIALGDQPLITPAIVTRVLECHQSGLTVPVCHGRRGHPICIDGRFLEALLALPPEAGLRGLFHQFPEALTLVPLPQAEILVDMDTPEVYRRLRKEPGEPCVM